jgi:glycosyltransferase involved in cell wall biosynthesis
MEPILFPIDTRRFKPAGDARSRLPYGKFLLLTARINDLRKNVSMLLEAFAEVRAQRPDLSLVTVGGHPSQSLLDQCRSLGLQDSVYFVEHWLTREELIAHYQSAELFVLSSVQEGLGIPVLEAIACGLPVVSTDCGGPSSVVVEGQTGLLVANDDPDALADGILRLLADPQALDKLRASCVEFAAKHFSREVIETQFRNAFQEVFGRDLS